jgi:enoyl-CoA hydratase/carnithine racemase
LNPGGGGTERLPHLVGRGRALEIVLGANDFDGETAERYGYVNRALPDAELDGFVDVLARLNNPPIILRPDPALFSAHDYRKSSMISMEAF